MKSSPPEANRRIEMLVALGLSVVLITLHALQLFNLGPLWRDEISSLNLATKPTWSALWSDLVYDPFPVHFFWLLRTWSAWFGTADFTLRLLGFLVGVSGIGALWLSARLSSKRPPLLALALLGFSPTLIFWGDTLRPYGLGIFWIVIAFGCFRKLAQRPTWGIATGTLLVAVLSVQALFTNALLIFSLGMAACALAARQRAWRTTFLVLAIGLIAALSLLPYAATLQAGQSWASLRKDVTSLAIYLNEFRAAVLTGGTLWWWLWLGIMAAAIGFSVWRQKKRIRAVVAQSSDSALFGLVAGTLAFLSTLVFFWKLAWPTHIWYHLPCLAIAALSADLIFVFSLQQKGKFLRVALALVLVGIATPKIYSTVQTRASNLDVIAIILRHEAGPEDLIVLNPFTDGITFHRYYHGNTPFFTIPKVEDLSIHRWDEAIAGAQGPDPMQAILGQINQTLQAGNRVWLVSSFIFVVPPKLPPTVSPLRANDPRPLQFFQGSWSNQLTYDLVYHSKSIRSTQLPIEQPINVHETSDVVQFSGWKEANSR